MSDSENVVHNEDDSVAEPTRENSAEAPLPPIPDGGLAEKMPVWLQQAPGRPVDAAAPDTVDIASLAQSLELPPWLSALSKRIGAGQHEEAVEPAAAEPVSQPEAAPVAEASTAVEPVAVEEATAPVEETPAPSRPLGATVLAAQQNAAERAARPAKPPAPPIPAATPVDAEEFLRGGEITVVPEPRSRTPFIIAAILIVVLAAAAVWYFGA